MKAVTKIEIWSRGKNRDVYGNPYHAFIAHITFAYVSYFRQMIIYMPMSWGDSNEWECLKWALAGINEALGTEFQPNDERIVHHYKHVSSDADLENPLKWKTE